MNPNQLSSNESINIRTNGTTIISVPQNPTGKLLLIAIIINTKGASSSIARVYDSNATLGQNDQYRKLTLDTVNTVGRVEYGIPFTNGIYIVTETGTAPDLTVVYAKI